MGDAANSREILDRIKASADYRRSVWYPTWLENECFYLGYQWGEFDYQTGRPDLTAILELHGNRATLSPSTLKVPINNKYRQGVDYRINRLLGVQPSLRTVPESDTMASILASRKCDSLLQHVMSRPDTVEMMHRIVADVFIFGTGIAFPYWDESIAPAGDVAIRRVHPCDLLMDFTAQAYSECSWVAEHVYLPVTGARALFGGSARLTPAPRHADFYWAGLQRRDDYHLQAREEWVSLVHYYELPGRGFGGADGKHCVYDWASQTEIYSGPWPFESRELPHILFWDRLSRSSPLGFPEMASVIPNQKLLNQTDNHISNAVAAQHGVKTLIPVSGMPVAEWKPGNQIIPYDGLAGTPYFLTPPPIPEALVQHYGLLEQRIDSSMGVQDPSRGTMPVSHTSAAAYGLAIEADQTRFMEVRDRYVRISLPALGRKVLELYRQFASGERLVRMEHDYIGAEAAQFRLDEMPLKHQVRVEPKYQFGDSKYERLRVYGEVLSGLAPMLGNNPEQAIRISRNILGEDALPETMDADEKATRDAVQQDFMRLREALEMGREVDGLNPDPLLDAQVVADMANSIYLRIGYLSLPAFALGELKRLWGGYLTAARTALTNEALANAALAASSGGGVSGPGVPAAGGGGGVPEDPLNPPAGGGGGVPEDPLNPG